MDTRSPNVAFWPRRGRPDTSAFAVVVAQADTGQASRFMSARPGYLRISARGIHFLSPAPVALLARWSFPPT